jgi:transcription antitermination factor NusG
VIVQLTSNGEREKNIPTIVRAARQLLGDKNVEVCVPAVSQKVREDSHTMFFWDGYVFIEYVEKLPYMRLQETTYFQAVLCQPSPLNYRQKVLSFLRDKDLEPMRQGLQNLKLSDFSEEDDVKIVKGQFKNLLGKVSYVHEDGENVQVFVGLRSKQILMDFPASYLVKV